MSHAVTEDLGGQIVPAADMLRVLLIGEEPILHALLHARLSRDFAVAGAPSGHAEALAAARSENVDVVVIDADLTSADPAELVAGVVLVCAAPVVALSAAAGPGSPAAASLYGAGARAVLHKPAGRLPLDLDDEGFGAAIVAAACQAAGSVGLVNPPRRFT